MDEKVLVDTVVHSEHVQVFRCDIARESVERTKDVDFKKSMAVFEQRYLRGNTLWFFFSTDSRAMSHLLVIGGKIYE
jgi:hypothetical protein